jgi:hypothetical protein
MDDNLMPGWSVLVCVLRNGMLYKLLHTAGPQPSEKCKIDKGGEKEASRGQKAARKAKNAAEASS